MKKLIRKILCTFFGIHKWQRSFSWTSDYYRLDTCKCCKEIRFVEDIQGYKLYKFQSQMYKEIRKVYIEKIKSKIHKHKSNV